MPPESIFLIDDSSLKKLPGAALQLPGYSQMNYKNLFHSFIFYGSNFSTFPTEVVFSFRQAR